MFGSEGLKIGGKVFAMLVKGQLVVKLPALQVQGIVNSNAGKLFDPGHGRLMKEWCRLILELGVLGSSSRTKQRTLSRTTYQTGGR